MADDDLAEDDLADLRGGIDALDAEILALINRRAELAVAIGRRKDDSGAFVFSPEREDQVLTRLADLNPGPLDRTAVRAVFREIMSGSRAVQRLMRVAYLGPEHSFSHLALVEKFGTSIDPVAVGSIAGVFDMVHRRQADLGLVPIENSSEGRIGDTLDMFTRVPLKICDEITLRIHHNLLGRCRQSEVRSVYSKPQALAQCRNWLATNVPGAQLKEVASTTTAAQLAAEEPGAAAVASRQAATAYGLDIIAASIEDRENNVTRFAVVGQQTAGRSGDDKTSVMFKLPDQTGALFAALQAIQAERVNMSWIESFPARGGGPTAEYLFFIDLAGHASDEPIRRVLAALQEQSEDLVVLGAYPRGEVHE